VTTALFALLYGVLPGVHLGWRDVTTGAFVTAVLFTLGQQVIGLYVHARVRGAPRHNR